MTEALLTAGVALGAFVSTNVDNLFLLLGYFSSPDVRSRNVVLGYLGAVAIILTAGVAISMAAAAVPTRYLDYLGILPITFGVVGLVQLIRGVDDEERETRAGGAVSIAVVMLANGGDSLAAISALMADLKPGNRVVAAATVAVLAVAWCFIAGWLGRNERWRDGLQRVSKYALPFLLIAVGVFILLDAPTDMPE